MDTYEFLAKILPSDGVTLVAVSDGKSFRHKGFTSLEAASTFIRLADSKGLTVYHACAAYKRVPYEENGKLISRNPVNWQSAKAFWCDIDCGQAKADAGVGYATQREGAAAVLQWARSHGLPMPMFISSGRGLHVYWTLTEAILPSHWKRIAESIKVSMTKDGLLADPTRTADMSSILRPVGTMHRKDRNNPLPVRLISKTVPDDVDVSVFEKEFCADATPSWLEDVPLTEEDVLVTQPDYPDVPVDINKVADHCAQVAAMRDSKGDVSYDHWRGVIGLIKVAKADVDVAREWSERRAETGHKQVDFGNKYNTWTSGPTTCAFFQKCNPDMCKKCKHSGKIKTPLVLGRVEPEPDGPEVVDSVTLEGDGHHTNLKIEIPELPKGYQWQEGIGLVRFVTNKEGNVEPRLFCKQRFYLYGRIRNAEGRYECVARAHLPRNVVRQFNIPGGIIGAGGSKLFEMLGGYEICTANGKDAQADMHAYLKDSLLKLTNDSSVTNTYTHYGWQEDDSFLVGSRLYRPNGDVVEALLSGNALDQKAAFPSPKGTAEAYAERLNWVYNRDGMEPLQYLICSLWAAPLVNLCEPTYNGIPCALTGANSGKGKSTAATAALYAFGQAFPHLTFSGKEGATAKAQSTFLGTLRNLPVLFDEVTNKTSQALSDLCYSLSNGVENMRLRSSGGVVVFGNRESWRTQVAMTANSNIGARLAEAGNSEAEAMRVFEIRIDHYNVPMLDPLAVSAALADMEKNTGAAGEVMIRWLVTHRKDAVAMLLDSYKDIASDDALMREPKYRFYRNHIACTITMARIAKMLGIIEFDIDKLLAFAGQAIQSLFGSLIGINILSQEEVFSAMMAEFSPRIIVTPTFSVQDGHAPYEVRQSPNGIVGRAIRGGGAIREAGWDGRLLLSARAIRAWCSANRADAGLLADFLTNNGVLLERNVKYYLTKGTTAVTAQQRCWVLNMNKMEDEDVTLAEANREYRGRRRCVPSGETGDC